MWPNKRTDDDDAGDVDETAELAEAVEPDRLSDPHTAHDEEHDRLSDPVGVTEPSDDEPEEDAS